LQKCKACLQNPLFSTAWAERRVDGETQVKTIQSRGALLGIQRGKNMRTAPLAASLLLAVYLAAPAFASPDQQNQSATPVRKQTVSQPTKPAWEQCFNMSITRGFNQEGRNGVNPSRTVSMGRSRSTEIAAKREAQGEKRGGVSCPVLYWSRSALREQCVCRLLTAA
jgi:hypothetical protein